MVAGLYPLERREPQWIAEGTFEKGEAMNIQEALAVCEGYSEGNTMVSVAVRVLLDAVQRLAEPAPDAEARARAAAEAIIDADPSLAAHTSTCSLAEYLLPHFASQAEPKPAPKYQAGRLVEGDVLPCAVRITKRSCVRYGAAQGEWRWRYDVETLDGTPSGWYWEWHLRPHIAPAPEPARPKDNPTLKPLPPKQKFAAGQEVLINRHGSEVFCIREVVWNNVLRAWAYDIGDDEQFYGDWDLHLAPTSQRPAVKYEPGQVVDDEAGNVFRLIACYCRDGGSSLWDCSSLDGKSLVCRAESLLKPHTMTAADLTPEQRGIWPGMNVRLKNGLLSEDGLPVAEDNGRRAGEEFVVWAVRMSNGECPVIYAGEFERGVWPWNLEPVAGQEVKS